MRTPLERIDFERRKERFDAYWRGEVPDRPLVAITCPRDEQTPRDFPVPDTVRARWTDVEYQRNQAVWKTENTCYLGDSLPFALPNLGPDSFSAFLGADLRFVDDGTSWVEPCVGDLAEFTPQFDRSNDWWRLMCELIDALGEAGEGRFLVGVPDLHGGGDSLAALRHPDRLALDLYDKPAEVRRIMADLTRIYKEIVDEYCGRIEKFQDGHTTWLHAYSRGRYTALQNDFSGLISPEMFAEFFLDDIRELADYLDNSLYHLDGPIAIGNLPYLLEVDELDGIQWTPGAGAKPMREWTGLCRRVLQAGKCLYIGCPARDLMEILGALPHEGLFVTTGTESEAAGRRLMEQVEEEFGTGD